jgi:hypothetical protein
MKAAAKHLGTATQDVMRSWEVLVKKEVPASRKTNTLALYDHLPDILNDISEIFTRIDNWEDLTKNERYLKILENSIYHGRHSASTQQYTVEQIIHEYIIFHRVLADELITAQLYDKDIASALKHIIETAMLKSVGSFSQALQEMQEKLIGTLAHDIRNPLAAAQLSLEMMSADADTVWLEKMKETTTRSVKKALELIEGLMDAITIKAGEGITLNFEEVNIAESISYTYKEATEIYTQKIELILHDGEYNGIFDQTAVRRLLENLLTNAIKYGDGKRPVTITLSDEQEAVTLSVYNSGNPISIDKQERIFDFLAKEEKDAPSYKSWGMGLALVKMVAEAHNGSMELQSSEETGTIFKATLQKNSNKVGKIRARLRENVLKNQK